MHYKTILILLCLVVGLKAGNPLSGYFGYKDTNKSKPASYKKEHNNSTTSILKPLMDKRIKQALKNPRSMTAKEFEETLTYAQDKARITQKENDMVDWLRLNNMAVEMASDFQKLSQVVMFKNPQINNSVYYATSGMANRALSSVERKKRKENFTKLTKKAAIIVIYDQTPPAIIKSYRNIIWTLQASFKQLIVKEIDASEDKGIVEQLHIEITPSTWLLYQSDDGEPKWYRVGHGLITYPALRDNIMFVFENIIKPEYENVK